MQFICYAQLPHSRAQFNYRVISCIFQKKVYRVGSCIKKAKNHCWHAWKRSPKKSSSMTSQSSLSSEMSKSTSSHFTMGAWACPEGVSSRDTDSDRGLDTLGTSSHLCLASPARVSIYSWQKYNCNQIITNNLFLVFIIYRDRILNENQLFSLFYAKSTTSVISTKTILTSWDVWRRIIPSCYVP